MRPLLTLPHLHLFLHEGPTPQLPFELHRFADLLQARTWGSGAAA